MPKSHAAIAVFHSHESAEQAVRDLGKGGFDLKKLSIIGRDYHTEEHVVGYYNTGDRMQSWGQRGAFWGAVWGILFGSAFFVLPGLGPILIAGPFVAVLVSAMEGAAIVGGIGVLGGALASLGVPDDTVLQYEQELKTGKYLVIVHGTPDEVQLAKRQLDAGKMAVTTIHSVPPTAAV